MVLLLREGKKRGREEKGRGGERGGREERGGEREGRGKGEGKGPIPPRKKSWRRHCSQ